MKHKPITEAEAASKLHQAIVRSKGGASPQEPDPEELSCEQLIELLPAFIDAERAGVDVDTMAIYAAVLKHFDRCPDCLELYAALSESLDAIEGLASQEPADSASSASFMLAGHSDKVKLYLMRGPRRCFCMVVPVPEFGPSIQVMDKEAQLSLFSGTLQSEEIAAQIFVSAAIYPFREPPELLVAVGEQNGVHHWQVQLQLGSHTYSRRTNEQGIARISGFSQEQLRGAGLMSIICLQESEEQTG